MKSKLFLINSLLVAGAMVFTGSKIPDLPKKTASEVPIVGVTMYWIDTEGGAATLIVTPAGESVLIDTGNPGGRDSDRIYDVAKNVAGLKQIDHLVTTHWHIDHYGGAALLSQKMPIIEVIDKGIPDVLIEDKKFAENIQAYRDMAVKKRTLIKPGASIALKTLPKGYAKLNMQFVGADKKFVTAVKNKKAGVGCEGTTDKAEDKSDNANSQVLVMDYGPFRFFDGGDLTWNIEKNLVCPKNLVGTVDVFQVNHHGLDQSNNPVLVKALAPTISIMGNGTRKGAGPETVTTLRSTSSIQANYQVHKNIRQDSEFNTAPEFIANMEENCQANYIKLWLTPDGKKYTVSIPATKHQKSFTTKTNH